MEADNEPEAEEAPFASPDAEQAPFGSRDAEEASFASRAYVALAAVFGAFFLVATPPLQVPDETAHLLRAWAVGHGQPVAQQGGFRGFAGVEVPRSLAGLDDRLARRSVSFDPERKQDLARVRAELEQEVRPDDRVPYVLPNNYSPLCYLAPGAAIRLAEVFGLPPLALLYAGRAANLVLSTLLVFAAIRLAPAHRFVLLLLGLMPMTMFQSAGLTADSLTNALGLFFCAVLLRECAAAAPLLPRRALGLTLLAAAVGVTKQVYWPLVTATAAIPARRFASPGRRATTLAAIAAGSAVPVALWWAALLWVGPVFMTPGVDPPAQVARIAADPLAFGKLLLTTLALFPFLVEPFVGVLGHLDTQLPGPVYLLYPVALVAVALVDGGPRSPVRGLARAMFLAAAALGTLSILFVAYVATNAVGAPGITGVLGRYFIPLAPFLLVALHYGGSAGLPRAARWGVAAFAAATLTATAFSTVSRYYAL
jgi:hypothetical protein